MGNKPKYIVEEAYANYEKAEWDLLKEGLKKSYTESFHLMTTLMKMNATFRKAKVTHKPFIPPASNV